MTESFLVPDTDFEQAADEVARIMRLLSNKRRLMILCKLIESEKSVTELTNGLGVRQSNVSQQLALLRRDGLVRARREAQTVYYSLSDRNVRRIMELLYVLYCGQDG